MLLQLVAENNIVMTDIINKLGVHERFDIAWKHVNYGRLTTPQLPAFSCSHRRLLLSVPCASTTAACPLLSPRCAIRANKISGSSLTAPAAHLRPPTLPLQHQCVHQRASSSPAGKIWEFLRSELEMDGRFKTLESKLNLIQDNLKVSSACCCSV